MSYTRQQRHYLSVFLLLLAMFPAIASGDSTDSANSTANMNNAANTLQPLDCVINPSVVADLGSSIPGVLSNVLVDRSDFIQAGQIVAMLESGVDTASLELARTRAALTAEIDLRRLNAAFGQRQYKRVEDLFAKQVISSKDMDQTHTETKLTQLQLRQAKDNQKLARLEVVRAQEVLERHSIRSPISGVVMDRFKTIGEYIDDQPIVRVAQLSPLHVEVIIPVQQLGKVEKGMLADVWSEAIGGKWQATVSRVDRVADVASGTFGVRLILENPDNRIPAGLRCRINFLPQEAIPSTKASTKNSTTASTETSTASNQAAEPAPLLALEPEQSLTDTKMLALMPLSAETDILDNSAAIEQCGWLGPYSDETTALTAATTLNAENLTATVEYKTTDEQTGFKVLSPLFDSKSQANAYLKRLRTAGDKDHFLLPATSSDPQQISLGLYSGPESAAQRATQLKKKGFDVITEPRYKQHEQYWLSIKGQQPQLTLQSLRQLASTNQRTELAPCNQQASR